MKDEFSGIERALILLQSKAQRVSHSFPMAFVLQRRYGAKAAAMYLRKLIRHGYKSWLLP